MNSLIAQKECLDQIQNVILAKNAISFVKFAKEQDLVHANLATSHTANMEQDALIKMSSNAPKTNLNSQKKTDAFLVSNVLMDGSLITKVDGVKNVLSQVSFGRTNVSRNALLTCHLPKN